jgi:hypothetical protein
METQQYARAATARSQLSVSDVELIGKYAEAFAKAIVVNVIKQIEAHMATKTITTHKPEVDKSGRTRLQPTKAKVSVSRSIAMKKSKKTKPVRRAVK